MTDERIVAQGAYAPLVGASFLSLLSLLPLRPGLGTGLLQRSLKTTMTRGPGFRVLWALHPSCNHFFVYRNFCYLGIKSARDSKTTMFSCDSRTLSQCSWWHSSLEFSMIFSSWSSKIAFWSKDCNEIYNFIMLYNSELQGCNAFYMQLHCCTTHTQKYNVFPCPCLSPNQASKCGN